MKKKNEKKEYKKKKTLKSQDQSSVNYILKKDEKRPLENTA